MECSTRLSMVRICFFFFKSSQFDGVVEWKVVFVFLFFIVFYGKCFLFLFCILTNMGGKRFPFHRHLLYGF